MRFITFFFILLISSAHPMAKAPSVAQVTIENIGVRTVKYQNGQRPVVVELWYPTEQAGPVDEPADPVWIHPQEVRDVPVAAGKYPLVIMSHGYGGDRRDRSWLADHLVKNGFVVASVEHHGNSYRTFNPLGSLRFWDRARDVSFAITQLLKDAAFKQSIDSKRIGFVGYSLGGMTGLALAGGKPENVKQIVKIQAERAGGIDPQLVEQIDFQEAYNDFSDRRIKAMVLLSPAAFVFPPNALTKVKVPVALVASEGDEVLPFKEHAFKIITHLVPKKLMLLEDKASHYVFLNRVSEIGKNVIKQHMHTDEIESDRLRVHQEVGAFVIDFFKTQL